jgi:hypothetical protein
MLLIFGCYKYENGCFYRVFLSETGIAASTLLLAAGMLLCLTEASPAVTYTTIFMVDRT